MTGALRVGIVGGGFMARTHAHAARAAGAQVVSILSSSPERSALAAHELGVAEAAGSLAQLIDASDVVHVTTPNRWHLEQSLAVVAAGKHVVCEKPLATTAADASRLVEAASGVVATVPFVYRFHPMAREARARVAAGGIGRLLTVRGAYLQDWLLDPSDDNWRVSSAEGGASRAFGDIGSHLVDLVEFVTGDRIDRVAARTQTAHASRGGHAVETEDAVALVASTASGALVSLLVSQVAAGRKNALTIEVSGSDATVQFAQERPDELWIGGREASSVVSRDAAILSPDAARLSLVPSGHPMGYLDAFTAFARDTYAAVRGEAPDGLPRFADGARAAMLTEAVLASAAADTWITVPAALEGAHA